ACILSPPYFSTVLALPYEPGDWRVLENPRFVLRQRRYSRTDATYGDDKNRLREHLSLQLTAPLCPSQSSTANWGSRRSVPDRELTASQFELQTTQAVGADDPRRLGPRGAPVAARDRPPPPRRSCTCRPYLLIASFMMRKASRAHARFAHSCLF